MKRKLLYGLGITALVLALGWGLFIRTISVSPPVAEQPAALQLQRTEPSPGFYVIGNNWLKKNDAGLYEMYLEGSPFERGTIYGKLAKEQVENQEVYFVNQIKQIVPSEGYLKFLKYFVGWFNRNLDKNIKPEYLQEIYGVSESASKSDFQYIGTPYQRILNYHAAHDIGHALQDKHMVVGCTSFGAWGAKSGDSSLIIGRNFDFYVGDDFARDKIVMFVNPDKGQKFMMVTWGGFIGTVSGMNMAGLTVTINAAKSDYPTQAATPISLVAREILQYATTIDEAYKIAKSRHTFVSESILIGSANDNDVAIIEKSPTKTELYHPNASNESMVCSNHFQGEAYANDANNQKQKTESSSGYRFARMNELLDKNYPLTLEKVASILRDTKGKNGTDIGIANEDAINQLIAHHSIIFKPKQRLVWISSNPVPFNSYVAYDLNKVFSNDRGLKQPIAIDEKDLRIAPDIFLTDGEYKQYLVFKSLKSKLKSILAKDKKSELSNTDLQQFVASNPQSYETYELLGDYYALKEQPIIAAGMYKDALEKDIPLVAAREDIKKKLAKAQKNIGGA